MILQFLSNPPIMDAFLLIFWSCARTVVAKRVQEFSQNQGFGHSDFFGVQSALQSTKFFGVQSALQSTIIFGVWIAALQTALHKLDWSV